MKLARIPVLLATLGLPLATIACSGSGGDDGGAPAGSGGSTSSTMSVISCSLGCSNGSGGTEVSCGILSIFVNQEISVLFSQAIDLASVTKNTFQVTEVGTGKSPTGNFSIDPTTPGRLIFRPQLTFNSSGQPIFGLNQGESYSIRIPGVAQGDPPPYILAADGSPNQTRLACTVSASLGINDPVPGPPEAVVQVTQVTDYDVDGNPSAFQTVDANGAVDVFRDTTISFSFNDIMNPATLVNPVTGTSDFITVTIDPDGNTNDTADQVPLLGSFSILIDQDLLQTTVSFVPDTGLPSAGSSVTKRKIVVEIPTAVVDLGNNPLINAGQFIFTPEFVAFPASSLPPEGVEDFTSTQHRDQAKTGAFWQNGLLSPGFAGGSGYLGELNVGTGEQVILGTQADLTTLQADFPTITNEITSLDVLPLGADVVTPGTPTTATITDGIYPFSNVIVRPGANLRFLGDNPARVFGAGEVLLQGELDVSGDEPPDDLIGAGAPGHESDEPSGGLGGRPGPGAGAGGKGADRADYSGNLTLIVAGAISNPGAVIDGEAGGPVGNDPLLGGGGPGGLHFPENYPTSSAPADWADLEINNDIACSTDAMAQPGGGGAFALDGGTGFAKPPILLTVTPPMLPPDVAGGDSSTIGLSDSFRTLNPDLGFLVGGSGGGGGGNSLHTTQTSGLPLMCTVPIPPNQLLISNWFDHSAAGGGGGGGALQINANRIVVDGQINATGGNGGTSRGAPTQSQLLPNNNSAAPGGGGSGGAVLLQAPDLIVSDTPSRIRVAGGEGGDQNSVQLSMGGDGSQGLVRLEGLTALDPSAEAPKIEPFDPASPTSADHLSTGVLTPTSGESQFSAAQSCWLRPDGNFFQVEYFDDDLSDPANPILGWDFDVVFAVPGLGAVSYRGANNILHDAGEAVVSFESFLGTDLKGSLTVPVVVRFQGVRAISDIDNLCDVDLSVESEQVLPESLTGWVRNPAELNEYWINAGLSIQDAEKLRPNMLRYRIVLDNSNGLFGGLVSGITNLRINVQPD